MSRVGSNPIEVPSGVQLTISGQEVTAKGTKGEAKHTLPEILTLSQDGSVLTVSRNGDDKLARSFHGLHRSLLANMIQGVHEGFKKELDLQGVGYRASVSGQKLEMFVGYTHAVIYEIPAGITIVAEGQTHLVVQGINKQLVGEVAARIRAFAPPEPYKGKGIRYTGEQIRRKAGKAVA